VRVWIDQDLCVGNGVCEELCPELFHLPDGGVAFVRQGNQLLPRGRAGATTVPWELEDSVLSAAEECPAECIFVEED
jgi:ferredoxin